MADAFVAMLKESVQWSNNSPSFDVCLVALACMPSKQSIAIVKKLNPQQINANVAFTYNESIFFF